jgi:transaldolase
MRDVSTGCDLLQPVWERREGRDGYVSIEVDANLADDTEATIAQTTHFHQATRPNLLVKIPATDAGVPAIEEMRARGYAINVTLIFSLTRHRQVAEAYLPGSSGSSPPAATRVVSTRSPASSSRASTRRPTAASPKLGMTTSRGCVGRWRRSRRSGRCGR